MLDYINIISLNFFLNGQSLKIFEKFFKILEVKRRIMLESKLVGCMVHFSLNL